MVIEKMNWGVEANLNMQQQHTRGAMAGVLIGKE